MLGAPAGEPPLPLPKLKSPKLLENESQARERLLSQSCSLAPSLAECSKGTTAPGQETPREAAPSPGGGAAAQGKKEEWRL